MSKQVVENALHAVVSAYSPALDTYDNAGGFVRMLLGIALANALERIVGTRPFVCVLRGGRFRGNVNISFAWPDEEPDFTR